MHEAHLFLETLAIVLCIAAVTTVLFQRLRQPVVLGYILAGLIVGPYLPIPVSADQGIVQTLSELGVMLLMFSLGLEFNLGKLFKMGPTAGLTAVVQCSLMVWLGFMVGRIFGWTTLECLFTGALIAISSTTIIAKAFDEQRIQGSWRELVVGILIVEDLIAILLMAVLTAVATGSGLSASALAITTGRLFLFLGLLVVIGLFTIPRAIRYVVKLNRPETTLVASIGICFAIALLAQAAGYSVALGAFLAGTLVSESGSAEKIEHLIQPVRDMFAAIFFVSVGMLIDPKVIVEHWAAVLVLTVVVVAGKIGSVALGAFLTGSGTRRSIQAGMSLAQIGEFSFIIAGLGLTLNATRSFLYPIAVAVSAITTLLTPWLIRGASPAANFVDRKLPRPMQTFTTLYSSWLEQLRLSRNARERSTLRKLIRLLVIDAAVLIAIVVGAAVVGTRVVSSLAVAIGIQVEFVHIATIALAVLAALPFAIGVFRLSGKLGLILAEAAVPSTGKVDLAGAPRKAFIVTAQVGVLLLVWIPVLAIIQPFFPRVPLILILLVAVGAFGIAFWRNATNLQGHVRAGVQAIVETLAEQSHAGENGAVHGLHSVNELLPGLGEPRAVKLDAGSFAVGRTLAQLNLRGETGATVLALVRPGRDASIPGGHEGLLAGDVLALAGTQEATAAAEALLRSGSSGPQASERIPA